VVVVLQMFCLLLVAEERQVLVVAVVAVDIFSVRTFCCKAEQTTTLVPHRTMCRSVPVGMGH
jgi:hypothetical protein